MFHTLVQKMIQNTAHASRGFTLVETLVAISILLLAIIGPMTIAQRGIQDSFFASDQTTAVFLAQEAIESIKKVRDDRALSAIQSCQDTPATCLSQDTWNWLGSNNINTNCIIGNHICDYDIKKTSTELYPRCDSAPGCKIYEDTSGGVIIYSHDSGGTLTKFTRAIKITKSGNDSVLVTSTVTWTSNILGVRSVVLQTWLYDQYKPV